MSHPSWVRGLKRPALWLNEELYVSHPSWVRGLKPIYVPLSDFHFLSHPSSVRGLKLSNDIQSPSFFKVAPLVGAWIETRDIGIVFADI